MKIFSSVCFALVVLCQIGSYLCFYYMGRVERSVWIFFNPFTELPMEMILLIALMIIWITSFILRKNRLWTTATLLGSVAAIFSFFVLPAPGSLVVYGIRNRIMQQYSVDDLRHFAQEVHQKIPDIDVNENESSWLSEQRGESYSKLEEKYPFMKLGIGSKGNPYINEKDDALYVEWGGALPGHWGFSIKLDGSKNEPYADPDTRVLRVSDDIYFYHGD